MADGRHFKNC